MMLPPEMPPFESNLTVMSFPNREELLFRTCLRGCARLANKAPSGVESGRSSEAEVQFVGS
jgi:hypothetical protein